MPNNLLFPTTRPNPRTPTTNLAGGRAYSLTDREALAQFAVTGTFNNTFYSSAQDQLTSVLSLMRRNDPEWIARVAVYARSNALMRDLPVFMTAYLSTLPDKSYFGLVFPHTVNNIGTIRTFVRFIRSGAVGRRSLGSGPKKAIARFLASMPADKIFWQCAGADPSFSDVLKLVHPRPATPAHAALFSYMLGREHNVEALPQQVRDFEAFKRNNSLAIPAVDFRRLSTLDLSTSAWQRIAQNMTWNQLRLNLNTLTRHSVWDQPTIEYVANRLADPKEQAGANVFPFALYSTFKETSALPHKITNAVQTALDNSLAQVPKLPGRTLVLVDVSGSMTAAVTGSRTGATSTVQCIEAASLYAAALLKSDPENVTVWAFDTRVTKPRLNTRDSLATITRTLAAVGGGTNCAVGITEAMGNPIFDNIIIISDNESWQSRHTVGTIFENYRNRRAGAKIVLWDLAPHAHTQVEAKPWSLHVGGYNDNVFTVIERFFTSGGDFCKTIELATQ